MERIITIVAFLVVASAAFITLFQTWLALERPPYGRYWLGFAAVPVFSVLMATLVPASFPLRQMLIDLAIGFAYVWLALGIRGFLGVSGRPRVVLVSPVVGLVSGVAYMITPESLVSLTIGSVIPLLGYVAALTVTPLPSSSPHPDQTRAIRRALVVGVVIAAVRVVGEVASAPFGVDTWQNTRTVVGLVTVVYILYLSYMFAGLIQQRASRELVQANHRLDQAVYDKRMGQLIASLSHKFGTPVFALRSLIPMLREHARKRGPLPQDMQHGFEHAEAAAKRLSRIVAQYRLLWDDTEDDAPVTLNLGDLFREVRDVGVSDLASRMDIVRDDGLRMTGPYRTTARLLSVILDYLGELGFVSPGGSLRIELVSEDSRTGVVMSGIERSHEDIVRLFSSDGLRLEHVSSARGLAYAWDRLREVYSFDVTIGDDPEAGTTWLEVRFEQA